MLSSDISYFLKGPFPLHKQRSTGRHAYPGQIPWSLMTEQRFFRFIESFEYL